MIFNFIRVIVVVGDGGTFPSISGSPAAPTSSINRALKQTSKMLGRFLADHTLAGQQRLVVLKVNENYSSQIPSCWSTVQNIERPAMFGAPYEEEIIEEVNQMGGYNLRMGL